MYCETSISFNPKEKGTSVKGKEVLAINAFIERLETNSYGQVMGVRFPVKEHVTEIKPCLFFDRPKHSARLIMQAPAMDEIITTIDDIIAKMPRIQKTEKNKTQNRYAEQMKENLHELLETKANLIIDSAHFKNADLAAAKFYEEKLSKYLREDDKGIITYLGGVHYGKMQNIILYVPKEDQCKNQSGPHFGEIGLLLIETFYEKGNTYFLKIDKADLPMTISIRNSFLAEEQQTGCFDVVPQETKFTKFVFKTYKPPKELEREELKKQKKIFEKM